MKEELIEKIKDYVNGYVLNLNKDEVNFLIQALSQSEGEKERAINFAEFISKNGFYRNASETNMLWATNDNDYYSGCLYTNDELYKEFLRTK